MTEETKLKQDLLNLANNLDYAKGLIIIKVSTLAKQLT